MGLKDVRSLLIDALRSERYQHEYRADMESRNLLFDEVVEPEFVIRLLQRCRGDQYACSPHHFLQRVMCHVFTPELNGERWYIKAYLLSADAVFISVHR